MAEDRSDRDKNIEMAMSQIERQFGTGAIMRMGDEEIRKMDVIPTGALSLDLALGIGGLPRGRVTEIFGPESSGKTTLATHVVAEAQRNGGVCAYIDSPREARRLFGESLTGTFETVARDAKVQVEFELSTDVESLTPILHDFQIIHSCSTGPEG